MPGSVRENDTDVVSFVKDNNIQTVLDVGAGKGTYGHLLGRHVEVIEAVEVWEPYIKEFKLDNIYDTVYQMDARDVRMFNYDLVVYGDILEHMSREDSLALWERTSEQARFGLISVPIIHYPQGAEFGNPYEVHVQEHMHPAEIIEDYGPFVFAKEYEITGTFIKEF